MHSHLERKASNPAVWLHATNTLQVVMCSAKAVEFEPPEIFMHEKSPPMVLKIAQALGQVGLSGSEVITPLMINEACTWGLDRSLALL